MARLTSSSLPWPPATPGGQGASGPWVQLPTAAEPPREPERQMQQRRPRLDRVARSRWTRWGLPALVVLCALAAAAAFEFPWLSDLWARHQQAELAHQLDDPAIGGGGGSGAAIGRIVIPAISLDMVVVQGTDAAALAKVPGHYVDSPMPCTVGDVAIAGHRTTFLHPFYDLNHLKAGDIIDLSTRTASCRYQVSETPFVVLPSDTAVVAATPGQFTLTLTTCNPIGSSAQRLVVKAQLLPPVTAPS